MCRLYGFRATHPTPVECELLDAQNAIIHQSQKDARGLSNADGWGIGAVTDQKVECVKQVGPAFESEEFRLEARQLLASTLISHVRRATVGGRTLANTHPFQKGNSLLAHNGHLDGFTHLRPRMLVAMAPEWRESIQGDTDSEHFFHLLLSRMASAPRGSLLEVLREAIEDVLQWSDELDREFSPRAARRDPAATPNESRREVALNVLWTVGNDLAASRLGRTLWYLERDRPHVCELHGTVHSPAPTGEEFRAVVLASEPITGEAWREVPENSVLSVRSDMRLHIEPLG